MISILAAFQFLSISPAFVRREFRPVELGRAVGFFPLIGAAIGALLWAFASFTQSLFPPEIIAVFTLGLWLLLTRALHFDGFLDSCDGLFGSFSPERRLEIMRDSRVGAFAVAGGGLLLLAKYAAILSLSNLSGLVLAPILGRWAVSVAIVAFPYARHEGLGSWMKAHAGWAQALLATLLAGAFLLWLAPVQALLLAIVSLLALFLLAALFMRRIGSLTGDAYGAICEVLELLVLLALVGMVQ